MPQLQAPSPLEKKLLGSMSRRQFAKRANLSHSYVARILKGERRISLQAAKQWSMARGLSIDDLYRLLTKASKTAAVLALLSIWMAQPARADQACAVTANACSTGGAAAGGDVALQANFCGPDNATNVEIGSCTNDASAGTGGQNTAIGNTATINNSTTASTAIGSGVSIVATGNANTAVGSNISIQGVGGGGIIAFGPNINCSSTGNNDIVIGNTAACLTNSANSLVIGPTAVNTASNQAVFGGNGFGYTDIYFGEGVANTTAVAYTIRGTGGSGADNAGGDVTIAPGLGTGNSTGEQVNIGRGLQGVTSSTAHSLAHGFTVCESKIGSIGSGSAQALAVVSLASNSAGAAHMTVVVTCNDGTNFDSDIVTSYAAFVNKAGVITVGTPVTTASAAANNSGSCTVGPTFVASGSTIELRVTPVFTTIVPTNMTAYINVQNFGAGTVTCQ